MTRPRFSLRGLLLLTAVVAGFCWYRDLPRQNANRFASLIEVGDYDAAFAMIDGSDGNFSLQWRFFAEWKVKKRGQSPLDWLAGRYRLTVWPDLSSGSLTTDLEAYANNLVCRDHRSFFGAR